MQKLTFDTDDNISRTTSDYFSNFILKKYSFTILTASAIKYITIARTLHRESQINLYIVKSNAYSPFFTSSPRNHDQKTPAVGA